MTAKQYTDELALRLNALGITEFGNDGLLISYINKGRQEAQKAALYLFPERFSTITRIALNPLSIYPISSNYIGYMGFRQDVYTAQLPQGFIQEYVVVLEWIDQTQMPPYPTKRRLCRHLLLPEFQSVQDHAFNAPNPVYPVYTIIRDPFDDPFAPQNMGYWIHLCGLQIDANTNLFNISQKVIVEIWHTFAPDNLEVWPNPTINASDFEDTIPGHLEELVFLYAMQYILQNEYPQAAPDIVLKEIQQGIDFVKYNFTIFQKKKVELKSQEMP